MQKNPDYWKDDEKYPGNRLPYSDEIHSLFIAEEATRLAGLRSGQIDFLGFPAGVSDITSVEVLESLQKNNPEIVLQAWWDRSETSFALDATKPPFDDVRVRRAMQMAIDLEGIDPRLLQGHFSLAASRNSGGRHHRVFHSPLKSGPKRSRTAIGTIRQGRKLCWMRPDIRAAPTALDSRPQ